MILGIRGLCLRAKFFSALDLNKFIKNLNIECYTFVDWGGGKYNEQLAHFNYAENVLLNRSIEWIVLLYKVRPNCFVFY